MSTVKFNEKNQALFFGLQVDEVTPLAVAALTASTAIPCTEISGDPTLTTKQYQFLGDSLSRDETTVLTDEYVEMSFSTFNEILNDVSGTLVGKDDVRIFKAFQACGGNVDIDDTAKTITVSNIVVSNDFASANRRLSSPDDPTNDKVYRYDALRGMVDVVLTVGETPALKFTMKGNVTSDPVAAAKQVGTWSDMIVAPAIMESTIFNATIAKLDDTFTNALASYTSGAYDDNLVTITTAAHSIPVGDVVAVKLSGVTNGSGVSDLLNQAFVAISTSSTTIQFYVPGLTGTAALTGTVVVKKGDTATKPFCYSVLTANNFFGFDYERVLDSCSTGFDKQAIPTDVSVTMLEDQVGGTSFDPDANVMGYFGVFIRTGVTDAAGKRISYFWDKLQISNVKEGKISRYMARDVTFRNTGKAYIVYS